jgi:hippurate hydrolase
MSAALLTKKKHQAGVRISDTVENFVALRRDFHREPELAFAEHRTAGRIAALLATWGFQVTTGLGGTGVVGTLRRGHGSRSLGLRADMDALPVMEQGRLGHASRRAGVMHACGHDGHMAILLAAAQDVALNGRSDGTLHVIFQPAEEIGAGARRMIADGLFRQHPCDAVFALHNWPGEPQGRLGFVDGTAMAAVDQALIEIRGHGGHGASPHETVDPVVVAAHLITALQTIVARNIDPLDMAVVTVGAIRGGEASNVISGSVALKLTARSFRAGPRALLQKRIVNLARSQAESFGANAEIDYRQGVPSVVNHIAETAFARDTGIRGYGNLARRPCHRTSAHAPPAKISHLCWKPVQVATSLSAMAKDRRCTAPSTISTTLSLCRQPATGLP